MQVDRRLIEQVVDEFYQAAGSARMAALIMKLEDALNTRDLLLTVTPAQMAHAAAVEAIIHSEIKEDKTEPVAMLWKVRKALALASAICDRVPNRWHHTHEIGSAEADIGDMVNAHSDGTHGYRLIQEAEAELVAYLTTPEAAPQRQPEQEPVAWMVYTEDGKSAYVTDNPHDLVGAYKAFALYTHPPRREWQGLTDEEIWSNDEVMECNAHIGAHMNELVRLARAIEAALKERNNG